MLRIGQVAKMYDISHRTLRYWEEQGILNSSRGENGYRFYDNGNTAKIRHIAMLRKLKMSIADIERIFISNDSDIAIDVLISHLKGLKQEVIDINSITVLIDKLIKHVKAEKDLTRIFSYLELQDTDAVLEEDASQILLSERNIQMMSNQLNNVRIVRLPAMTVASYRAESDTPEQDCAEVMNKLILENSLQKQSGFRHFGFNNPNPAEDNPVYGYEMWVSVPADFDVPAPLEKKRFVGGLYASIVTAMGDIDERWQQLSNWVSNSDKYTADSNMICMEECIDFETLSAGNDSEMQLDLLKPVKESTGGKV